MFIVKSEEAVKQLRIKGMRPLFAVKMRADIFRLVLDKALFVFRRVIIIVKRFQPRVKFRVERFDIGRAGT